MRENLLLISSHILSITWIFVVIGFIHGIVLENKNILKFFKQKKIKLLFPFFKRLLYLLLGFILIWTSFAAVNTLLNYFIPSEFDKIEINKPEGFWGTWKYYSNLCGIFAVIGLITAGESLILSAGSRWLVNLAKLITTITILYLFVSVIVSYA